MNVIPMFQNWGVKTVAPNDIEKSAFVPAKSQTAALHAAGISPQHGAAFNIDILFDPSASSLEASYYHAERVGSGRPPEPRMGRRFVSGWMQPGDEIVIGNIGNQVFAYKVTPLSPLPAAASPAPTQTAPTNTASSAAGTGGAAGAAAMGNTNPASATPASGAPGGAAGQLGATNPSTAPSVPNAGAAGSPSSTPAPGVGSANLPVQPSQPGGTTVQDAQAQVPADILVSSERELAEEIVKTQDPAVIMAQARKAAGAPTRRTVARADFARNTYVVAGALLRANGQCEMPGCTRPLFSKDDGKPYLEVHHVVPLGEGGEDTLVNAAGLCPHCHRELHFGANRIALRAALANHIAAIT